MLKGTHPTLESRLKMSISAKARKPTRSGAILSEETKRKISIALTGKPQPKQRGCLNHAWKGGVSPMDKIIRRSLSYRLWRTSVFNRDNYTCQECGKRGVQLHADHIKPFSKFAELRFEISNGRTLCVPCHKETPTYAGRAIHYQESLILG